MKGSDNQLNIIMLIISSVVAILQLIAAVKWPRIARFLFFCCLPGQAGATGKPHN